MGLDVKLCLTPTLFSEIRPILAYSAGGFDYSLCISMFDAITSQSFQLNPTLNAISTHDLTIVMCCFLWSWAGLRSAQHSRNPSTGKKRGFQAFGSSMLTDRHVRNCGTENHSTNSIGRQCQHSQMFSLFIYIEMPRMDLQFVPLSASLESESW